MRSRTVRFIACGALTLGCGSRAAPAAPDAPRADALTNEIRQACVPTGPETCFDARDDNCNGLIDEGCGVQSGIVEFAIAWDAPSADVDLLVTDPKGELVEVGRPSAAGLVKDRDCPGRQRQCKKNVENVYLEAEEAKRGTYRVKIRLERLEDEDVPIRVAFGARLGPRTFQGEVNLGRSEEERTFLFEL